MLGRHERNKVQLVKMCLYYTFSFSGRVRFVSGDLMSSYWCKNISALLLEHAARKGTKVPVLDWQADLLEGRDSTAWFPYCQ